MLEIKSLKKSYGERTVLNIDSLCVKKGETVVIVGPNGSGKSTLIKIIAGIIKQDCGEIILNCKPYYLPQQSVAFSSTVRKNILFSAEDKDHRERKCDEILTELELSHLSDKKATTLSGGECQRLALARVLVNSSQLLLLDEPSSAADIEGAELIENAIIKYKQETGCGILMTTHSPKQAAALADRIIMLHNGVIAEQGNPRELLSEPKTPWGRKFIDMWKVDS